MKCTKCNNESSFNIGESLKRVITTNEIPSTKEFECGTIYIKCNSCGYRQFGDKANKEFGLDIYENEPFDYSVTQEEVIGTLKELSEDGAEEIKLALEKGWKPTLDEIWECVNRSRF